MVKFGLLHLVFGAIHIYIIIIIIIIIMIIIIYFLLGAN